MASLSEHNTTLQVMKLRTLLVVVLAGTVALSGGGAGCSMLTNTGSDDERTVEFLVAEVDSLHVPARIAPTDTLTVRLQGTVGPDGCYSFDRFDTERSADRLTVLPVVKRRTGEEVGCTQAIVPLDRTVEAAPPFAEGTLTVEVPQPDRPDVTAPVEVER
jgi:hypothetical protein